MDFFFSWAQMYIWSCFGGLFIIFLINCSFKQAWALLQHDYWDQVDYIPNKLSMFLILRLWEHQHVLGMKQPQTSAFNQKSLHSGLPRTGSPSCHEWLLWCTSYRGNRKELEQWMSLTSQRKTSILLETSYYDLNSGEFNTPPETHRFWGHKWPCPQVWN